MLSTTIQAIATTTAIASAAPVLVEIHGQVEFNQINVGALGAVNTGENATLSFMLDSGSFIDSAIFPTRAYDIDLASLSLDFSGGSSLGANLAAAPSYFVVRNDDPAVDGFFIGAGPDAFPGGVPLDQPGIFDSLAAAFSVTYGDDPLSSLDITAAAGSYDFTGLTVFTMNITDGPFDAMGMIFESMTITNVPAPSALAPLALSGLLLHRRRR